MSSYKQPRDKTEMLDKPEPKLPLEHVAIIMDGNRRWADKKHWPRLKGHQEGTRSLKRLVRHVGALGLNYLTVYAFSSENWQRSNDEVNYLFELFGKVLGEELKELAQNNVRLRFIGQLSRVPSGLMKEMQKSMDATASNTGLNLQVAINYGSRLELTEAMQELAREVQAGRLSPDEITEETINNHLYTRGLPDPELLIRTGGEMRLSNYLLWQQAYTELYVTEVLWPDFTPEEFDKAIVEFTGRQRRWGT